MKNTRKTVSILVMMILTVIVCGCMDKKTSDALWLSVGDIHVGTTSEAQLIKEWGEPMSKMELTGENWYDYEDGRTVVTCGETVFAIGLQDSCTIKLKNGLKLGSTIADVTELVGKEPEQCVITENKDISKLIKADNSKNIRYYRWESKSMKKDEAGDIHLMIVLPAGTGYVHLICDEKEVVYAIALNVSEESDLRYFS